MIAIVCPGQGSQTPGMLAPWLEHRGADALLQQAQGATGLDLHSLGTTADAETITDTSVAQPLIVLTSLLSLHALMQRVGDTTTWAGAVAGHSVGEYAATAIAGVLSPADALHLVSTRGRAMASAAAARPSGMAAVVGGDPEQVAARLDELGLVAANANGGGQVVAAGSLADLDRLREQPPTRARVIPLSVAGAFHTSYMEPAVSEVEQAAAGLSPADPTLTLLTNSDGSVLTNGATALTTLVQQIARPVRWDLCQEQLRSLGVSALVELSPAGVLTGLARRTLPGVPAVALKAPSDLDAAVDLIAQHREESV